MRLVAMLLVTIACGCGSTPAHAPVEPAESPLKTMSHSNRPSLAVIERMGDDENAVAAALSFHAPGVWRASVQQHIEAALTKQRVPYQLQAHSHGLVVTLASPRSDARLLSKLELALREGLERGGAARTKSKITPVPLDPCLHLQSDPAGAPHIGTRNLALAVVGEQAFVNLQRTLYNDGPPWKEGQLPFDEPSEEYSFRASNGASASLWVALRTPERDRVLDAAARLSRRGSDLALRISQIDSTWSIEDVHFSDRPLSACLAVKLRLPAGPPKGQLARATRLLRRELRYTIAQAASRPIDHAALRSTRATTAAEASAWLALTQADGGQPRSETQSLLVTYRGPLTESARRELKEAPSPAMAGAPPVRSANYTGQGNVWLALGSACPVEHESSFTSGHTAAALLSAANQAQDSGVHLTLWTGRGGPALIAKGPALSPGDSVGVSRVMGRALAQALRGRSKYSEAASQLLHERRPQPALELGAQLVTGGRPSLLLPIGSHASLTGAVDEDMQRALGLFLEGPLKIAILSNAGDRQVHRMAEELTSWLPPGRSTECTAPDGPAGPGEYWVQTRQPDADAVLLYPVAPGSLGSARLVARWLRSPGGWLSRAVHKPGLVTSVDAVALGGAGSAAVVLALRAPPARVDSAVRQVRALLGRLAATPVDWSKLETFLPTASGTPPQTRLINLLTRPAPRPTKQSVADVLSQLTEKQLVVVRPTVEAPDSGPAGRSSK